MKQFFRYIFLLVGIFCFMSISYAQKKHKSTKKVTSNAKAKKGTKSKKSVKKNTVKITNTNAPKEIATLINPIIEKTIKMDSIPEKVVTILSDFKPQLKNVAKIAFNNASIQIDTTSLHIDYNVPSQNLSFHYKPISLVPRSYKIDSIIHASNNGSVKIGFGNFLQRAIDVNYNFKDALNNTHSISGYNTAFTGLHHLQSLNEFGFNYLNSISIDENNRLISKLYFKQSDRYRYGMVPDASTYPIANYAQNYTLIGASIALLNDRSEFGIVHFKPIVNYEHFEGISGASNNWVELTNKMVIKYKSDVNFHFDLSYSFNQLKTTSNGSVSNSYMRLDPTIQMNKFNSNINLGISPIAENGKFNLYPILSFRKKLRDTSYILMAGWNTLIVNNQYTSLVATNPWINVPGTLALTTQDKKFIEIQVNAGSRLDYGINFSINNYKNLPLFNRILVSNTNQTGLLYNTLFEKEASTIELQAKLRYQFSDKILIVNDFKYLQFNSLLVNAKPWGILPIELNSKINWTPSNHWNIVGGIQYWSGASMYNDKMVSVDLKNSLNIHAMLQYQLTSHWSTWIKGDNLLDKPYERWLDYPSLGVQLIGGVVYSFRK